MSIEGACSAVLVGTTLYSSQAVAMRMFRDADRCVRWSAGAVLGTSAAVIAFEALAALRSFRPIPALVVAIAGALATRWLTRVGLFDVVSRLVEDLSALVRFVVGEGTWTRPLRAALAVAAGSITARALILPPLAHDTVSYHGPRAAMWVQNGGDLPLRMPGGWAVYRHLPRSGEILGAWAMLPSHDDTLYLLVDVAVWLAWLPAIVSLCAELDIARKLRAPIALYVMTIPGIYFFLPGGYVDVTAHMLVLCMLAFTLRALNGRHIVPSAAIAMLAGMTAVSVKTPALPLPGIVGISLLISAFLHRARMRELTGGVLIGSVLGMAVLIPMLTRNTIELGVPLGPVPLHILGFKLGELRPEQIWYFNLEGQRQDLANEIEQLATMFGLVDPYRPTFGAASVLLVAVLPVALFVRARNGAWLGVLFLSLVFASQAAAYWSPSFALIRNHYGYCNARFFMLVPTIAALLAPSVFRGPFWTSALAGYLILAAAISVARYLAFFPSAVELDSLLVWSAIGLGSVLLWPRVATSMSPRASSAALPALAALVLVFGTPMLQQTRAPIRYVALMHSMVGHRFPVEWTEFARLTDDVSHPRRIALVSGPLKEAARQLMYFFLGTKLQNELVYISPLRNGATPVFDRSEPSAAGADMSTWLSRIRERGVQYVALFSPPWIETPWIASHPSVFKVVAANQASVLFRVQHTDGSPEASP